MRRVRTSRIGNLTAGLIALVLVAIGVTLAQRKELPFRHHFTIEVAFRSVNGLHKGSPVRLAGVAIGKVVGMREHGDRSALVQLRLEDNGLPLHRDATFKIRPRLFLEGNFFVDVEAGSPRAPLLRDGAIVPVQQSATPVQFDQVLTALDTDTRSELQTVLQQYGRALHGGAKAVNRTYRYTGPAYRDTAILADAQLGDAGPHQLSGYVRDAGTVARGLDRSPQALQDLIVGLYGTARGFASAGDQLDATLRELPRTLTVALPALRDLNTAFPPLRRFVAGLRPALQTSVPALDATLPLARQLRGLVRPGELRGLAAAARVAAPSLARANRTGVPLGEQVRLGASCNTHVLIPWSQERVPDPHFPAVAKVYEEGARTLVGLSGESRSGDANGQWFRTLFSGGNASYQVGAGRILTTSSPIGGINPPYPGQRPPLRRGVPCETQQRPDLRSTAAAPPARIATDANSPAARTRIAGAQQVAVDWLRQQITREGLDGKLKVTGTPLSGSIPKGAGIP